MTACSCFLLFHSFLYGFLVVFYCFMAFSFVYLVVGFITIVSNFGLFSVSALCISYLCCFRSVLCFLCFVIVAFICALSL